MPTKKTEGTELSLAFGLLAIKHFTGLNHHEIEGYFTGTLSQEKYQRFLDSLSELEELYGRMYDVGLAIRANYPLFKGLNSLRWEGPNHQAATSAAATDLLAANTPVSVKGNSNVVLNSSPHNFFIAIPSGRAKAARSSNWFLEQAPTEYKSLYTHIRNRGCQHLPADVREFEETASKQDRTPIKDLIKNFSPADQETFQHLYKDMCHQVAKASADMFNHIFNRSMQGNTRSATLETVVQNFFRIGNTEYILGGIDQKGGGIFAVVIPTLTEWKRSWKITDIRAMPELDRSQSVVHLIVNYKNTQSNVPYESHFHVEIRWSHGKFQGAPEAKLYKEFAWDQLAFFTSLYGQQDLSRLSIIGKGSFGIVYKAMDRRTNDLVAIKEFPTNLATTQEERRRFEREIRILAHLNHPNILPVLDYELASADRPWFSMPLANSSVADILEELRGDYPRINHLFLQTMHGMAFAHQNKIIHRDLKPQNLFVFPEDLIKIGDFGFGKRLQSDQSTDALTATDDQFGTLAYMAPEQYGSSSEVDHRADIFALGKTLMHMITGETPPYHFKPQLASLPEPYRSFIEKATEEDPDHRYESVDLMITEFLSFRD